MWYKKLMTWLLILLEEKRIWSLIALAIGILYAVMASVNYNIQAVAVRMSLAAGETEGSDHSRQP